MSYFGTGTFWCGAAAVMVYLIFTIGWLMILAALLTFCGYLFLLGAANAMYRPDGSRRPKTEAGGRRR